MSATLVPIVVGGVLPISIILIKSLSDMYNNKKRTELLMKAIESDNNIDTDKLVQAMSKPRKTAQQILLTRLLRGCIFSFIGIILIAVGLFNLVSGAQSSSDPVCIPLLLGGISLAIGASYLVVYFVSKKSVNNRNEQE